MVSDLGQIEKRLERLEKDLKKMKTPELEKEYELLKRAKAHLEIGEAAARNGDDARGQEAASRLHVPEREADFLRSQHRQSQPNLAKISKKRSAKYKLTEDRVAPERRGDRHLRQGRSRTCRDERCRRGRISFQLRTERKRSGPPHPDDLRTAGPDLVLHGRRRRVPRLDRFRRTRARRKPRARSTPTWKSTSSAPKPFAGISLLEAGSEANARAKGTLRLEGKDYIVQDGDVMHIRHSG